MRSSARQRVLTEAIQARCNREGACLPGSVGRGRVWDDIWLWCDCVVARRPDTAGGVLARPTGTGSPCDLSVAPHADRSASVAAGCCRSRPEPQIHDLNHMWLSQNSYGTGIAVQIG